MTHAAASAATHNRGKHETRTDSTEVLIRRAHELLALYAERHGLVVKPAKVAKLARRYAGDEALRGTPFDVWLVSVVTCPPEAPRPLRNFWGVVDSTGTCRSPRHGGR